MIKKFLIVLGLLIAPVSGSLADEVSALIQYKSLSPDMAHNLVKYTLDACRKEGYQVSVAVVDRGGNLQAMLRDQFAGAGTAKAAEGKAWTAVNFHTSTQDLMEQTQPGTDGAAVRQLPGVLAVGGGIMIEAGGTLVGALGVSGAPGGGLDDGCARTGLDMIQDDLDF